VIITATMLQLNHCAVLTVLIVMYTSVTYTLSLSPTTPIEPATSTKRPGCFYNGKWYEPGQEISRGFDGKNWCYGIICDKSGSILAWDNFNCRTTTSQPPTITPSPATPVSPATSTTRHGCFYGGKWYEPGQEIYRRFDGNNWCYGAICEKSGLILFWDNFNCGTTTPKPPTSTPASSPPPTTSKRRCCYYKGRWYEPGEEVSRWYVRKNRCFIRICNKSGHVLVRANFKCGASTPKPPYVY